MTRRQARAAPEWRGVREDAHLAPRGGQVTHDVVRGGGGDRAHDIGPPRGEVHEEAVRHEASALGTLASGEARVLEEGHVVDGDDDARAAWDQQRHGEVRRVEQVDRMDEQVRAHLEVLRGVVAPGPHRHAGHARRGTGQVRPSRRVRECAPPVACGVGCAAQAGQEGACVLTHTGVAKFARVHRHDGRSDHLAGVIARAGRCVWRRKHCWLGLMSQVRLVTSLFTAVMVGRSRECPGARVWCPIHRPWSKCEYSIMIYSAPLC